MDAWLEMYPIEFLESQLFAPFAETKDSLVVWRKPQGFLSAAREIFLKLLAQERDGSTLNKRCRPIPTLLENSRQVKHDTWIHWNSKQLILTNRVGEFLRHITKECKILNIQSFYGCFSFKDTLLLKHGANQLATVPLMNLLNEDFSPDVIKTYNSVLQLSSCQWYMHQNHVVFLSFSYRKVIFNLIQLLDSGELKIGGRFEADKDAQWSSEVKADFLTAMVATDRHSQAVCMNGSQVAMFSLHSRQRPSPTSKSATYKSSVSVVLAKPRFDESPELYDVVQLECLDESWFRHHCFMRGQTLYHLLVNLTTFRFTLHHAKDLRLVCLRKECLMEGMSRRLIPQLLLLPNGLHTQVTLNTDGISVLLVQTVLNGAQKHAGKKVHPNTMAIVRYFKLKIK